MYYIFKPAVDTPETGSQYPQIQKMAPGYDYKAPDSVHALSKAIEQLPTYTPHLDYFIVHGKAKLTDLLSVAVVRGGFLISERFKSVIQEFHLPSHKFYPAKVLYKERFHDYYWMHIICNLTGFIDYPKSTFFIYHNFSKNVGYIDISSKEELIKKEEELKKINPGKTVAIWAEKLHLNEMFDSKLDLFKIGNFDANFYISKALYDAIVEQKITGCSAIPASNLISK